MAGLGENLKADNGYYLEGATIPKNTTLNSASIRTENGAINGAQAIYVEAKTDIVISDTKVLTVNIEDSADDTTFAKLAEVYTVTASGATTITAGTIIANFILPDNAKTFTRVSITTNDASVVGTGDAYLQYKAR